jgi:hypothetical protein
LIKWHVFIYNPYNWSINLIRTIDPHIPKIQKKKYWTSNPSHEFQDWPKKKSFLETGVRFISYRLSHKRAKLVNWTSSCDRRTDGRTDRRKSADNSIWKYAKKLLKSKFSGVPFDFKLSFKNYNLGLRTFKSSLFIQIIWGESFLKAFIPKL